MTYTAHLNAGQHLTVDQRGSQTAIALHSSATGQQQSQQLSLSTGTWTTTPTLFRTTSGYLLQIDAAQGSTFVQIQAGGMQTTHAPAPEGQQEVPLEFASESTSSFRPMEPMPPMEPMKPMAPMSPLPPMQMGNMQMQMNPMTMRMGDMELQMGDRTGDQPQNSGAKFCTQCGSAVKQGDRFCAQCGNRLEG